MGNSAPKVKQNFEVDRYMGVWYEAYRTKKMRFEFGECTTAVYSPDKDGYFGIRNTIQEWVNGQDGDPVKSSRRFVQGWGF